MPASITPATTNYRITTGYPGNHETSGVWVPGANHGLGGWVVGWNHYTSTWLFAGWSFSDQYGTSWTPNAITSGTQFGSPSTASPYDGAAFAGWRSDPSLGAVTDPTLSESGQRVMYSMVACTGTPPPCETNDVIVALSRDGGHSFNYTSWVNNMATGGTVDNPWIATNPISPYHSFVAWTSGIGVGHLAQVEYSAGSSPVLSVTNYTRIPYPLGLPVYHPRIAVGKYLGCNSTSHEAVFVTYATAGVGRCPADGTQHLLNESWYIDVFDVTTQQWFSQGPFQISPTENTYPLCVGGPYPSPNYGVSNDVRPHLAVDYGTDGSSLTTDGQWFASHTVATPNGTRAMTDYSTIVCSGGNNVPGTISHDQSPDPCDDNGNGCQWNGGKWPDGGTRIQDEWGTSIAFNYKADGTPRVVRTWYTTRDDPYDVNVDLYMAYSEDRGATWTDTSTTIQEITIPVAPAVIPWPYTRGGWADYQSIAPNPNQGSFLGTWGGDCRNATTCGIYSTIMN